MLHQVLRAIGHGSARRPWVALGALLVLAIPATWLAVTLQVRSSFLELLPEDSAPVEELEEVLEHSRSSSDVTIAIDARRMERAEAWAAELSEALRADPAVDAVGGRVDTEWFHDRQMLYTPAPVLARLAEQTEAAITERRAGDADAPVLEGLYAEVERIDPHLPSDSWMVTRNRLFLVVRAFFVSPASDLDAARSNWELVQRIVDEHRGPDSPAVRYAGSIPARVDEERALLDDLRLAGIVGFAAVLLLIAVSMRSLRALVVVGLPLLLGMGNTFALAHLLVGHLNILSGFLFSILSGLGIEHGIHLLKGFRERQQNGEPLEQSVEELVVTTGRALFSGAITNACVFATLALADFRGFREFGIIAAIGLLATLASMLVGVPALIVVSERIAPTAGRAASEAKPIPLDGPIARVVLWLGPLFAAMSIYFLASGALPFDARWKMLTGDRDIARFGSYLRDELQGTYDAAVIWVRDASQVEPASAAILELRDARMTEGKPNDIIAVSSLADFHPSSEVQSERAAQLERLRAVVSRIDPSWVEDRERFERALAALRVEPFEAAQVPESVREWFGTLDGVGSLVYVQAGSEPSGDSAELVAWAEQADAITGALEERGIAAALLSETWVAGEAFREIWSDGPWVLAATIVIVFAVLVLDLWSLGAALAVLAAVLMGIVSMAGGMWLFDVRLNFVNACILPACIGISLDNALHVLHRWRGGGAFSMGEALRHTASANALSSTSNLAGFGALAVADHAGMRSIAYLAVIGVLLTYFTTTIWFPVALHTFDRVRGGRG